MNGLIAPKSTDNRSFPDDVYLSLVGSLFDDARSLFVGSVAATASAAIAAWRTGEPLLLVFALAIIGVAGLRGRTMHDFHRRRGSLRSADEAAFWERRYQREAVAYVTLLGGWCVAVFTITPDPFVRLLSFSLTLVYMIGISGRNFANDRLVIAQTVSAGVLMTMALFVAGGDFQFIIGLVVIPFFLSLRTISARLRNTLLDAVNFGHDVSLLAERFDTALSNMPLGLAMFDANQRLIVGNRRLSELLGIGQDAIQYGVDLQTLVSKVAEAGRICQSAVARVTSDFEVRLSGKVNSQLTVDLQSGQTFQLKFHSMVNGGALLLIEDVTERRDAEAKINRLAHFDTLTGLANRGYFRKQMEQRLAASDNASVCALHFIDLDNFKQVNDTLGHPVGDKLLQAVCEKFSTIVRATDIVCRFGGDEFLIFQAPIERADQAESLADRIIGALNAGFSIDGHDIMISASIGITIVDERSRDTDMLVQYADMALYSAKAAGKSTWRVFEDHMEIKAKARRTIETDMRKALEADEFELHYQPIVGLHSGRIVSCEGLLRWRHPVHGMIQPMDFIPIAEETGLIVDLGAFVIRQACRECATWPDPIGVAVNLSPIQFQRSNLPAVIKDALANAGLAPGRLEVEITESVLLQNTDATRFCLDQLKDMGVKIALDDFGTGYSSLSYLHKFALDKVKIDRSFIQGIETNVKSLHLLSSMARLIADLGMSTVIEGVETGEQLAILKRQISVGQAQGYLFSRPVPSQKLFALFAHGDGFEQAA